MLLNWTITFIYILWTLVLVSRTSDGMKTKRKIKICWMGEKRPLLRTRVGKSCNFNHTDVCLPSHSLKGNIEYIHEGYSVCLRDLIVRSRAKDLSGYLVQGWRCGWSPGPSQTNIDPKEGSNNKIDLQWGSLLAFGLGYGVTEPSLRSVMYHAFETLISVAPDTNTHTGKKSKPKRNLLCRRRWSGFSSAGLQQKELRNNSF